MLGKAKSSSKVDEKLLAHTTLFQDWKSKKKFSWLNKGFNLKLPKSVLQSQLLTSDWRSLFGQKCEGAMTSD